MFGSKDLITADNVIKTYPEGRYICFLLKNGITVKLNPNETPIKRIEANNKEGKT